jgi:hypothetical protein
MVVLVQNLTLAQGEGAQLYCRVFSVGNRYLISIEEGRGASKSPHTKFGYFLSISQQGVSADIIQNSAVGNFSPKTEETKTKAARC